MADGGTRFGERDLAAFEVAQQTRDRLTQAVRFDEPPIGVRRRRESGRHFDALLGQMPHHLAERSVLAADQRYVAAPERFEPHHKRRVRGHSGAPLPTSGRIMEERVGASLMQINFGAAQTADQSRLLRPGALKPATLRLSRARRSLTTPITTPSRSTLATTFPSRAGHNCCWSAR